MLELFADELEPVAGAAAAMAAKRRAVLRICMPAGSDVA